MSASAESVIVANDGMGDQPARLEDPEKKHLNGRKQPASQPDGEQSMEVLEGEVDDIKNGLASSRPFKKVLALEEDSDNGSLSHQVESPLGSVLLNPNDPLSLPGSVSSTPGSSILPSAVSRQIPGSPSPSLRPFDRRFQSRLASLASLHTPRPSSPAYLGGHSRQVSLSSQLLRNSEDTETVPPPWEVVRWTKLKKLSGQAFSELGRRNFGSPTCISISASIVLGTSKGIILIFDYHQNLKSILGPGTKAVESGSVTSIATSADHSTIASGHTDGSIFTWDTNRPARPFLHISHLDASQLRTRSTDGHLPNSPVTQLGFLGTRHTALVSANDCGMAFSHLASRGTGSLGRSVTTTRILGRYPHDMAANGKSRKPSTVLAFAPLPLGNVEQGTDNLGLTAMLTPYLLVIVSTTPIAQTQYKAPRPKEVAAHSAMSGCLAWFPAVKLKVKDPKTGDTTSRVKLVYCWSNVLTIMVVEEVDNKDKDKPPTLLFKARSRWKAEEAIVAVQWLSRSVLCLLTITQRLIVLEDQSMRITEAFDLVQKHIFHQDLFSRQLYSLVEQLDEVDSSMHGVVADAFYMSFKAYKGRLFLLGFNDISIGTFSNWADRLIALMEDGDYVGAIQLATSYYTGDTDKLTVGLPEDTVLRHSMVRDKAIEIMTASLKYAFSKSPRTTPEAPRKGQLGDLSEVCFDACLSIGDIDFLFEEVYGWFEDAGSESIFLDTLEPHILNNQIRSVPPVVVKALVTHYVTKGLESRLEDMFCRMDTSTMDIDQVSALCKQHNLYDALIYIWNQALRDYITPLVDLLSLLIPPVHSGDYFSDRSVGEDPMYSINASKMFPYMSYTFTSRVYPTGDSMDGQAALNAKAELYWFLFSGKSIPWPRGSDKPFKTIHSLEAEPSFPYLRMILKFDASSFLSTLNEAFEDSFLNDNPDRDVSADIDRNMTEEHIFGLSIDRQYIVSILLEIMNPSEFTIGDTVYLDMFVARNLPKFPQYLLLSGSALHKVLTGLCSYPSEDIADDAQLSAEYLLSVYHPTDLESLMPLFKKAGFYRVLKRIYRTDKQYSELLRTYFDDHEDQEAIFDVIAYCLRARTGLTKRQLADVYCVIQAHAFELVHLDLTRTAQTIEAYAPSIHKDIIDVLLKEPELEYIYLETILEPAVKSGENAIVLPSVEFVERYIRLMCRFNPSHVADYVGLMHVTDLRLDRVLPTMEEAGVIDAAVMLLAREGQVRKAMDRLIGHLGTLEAALLGLLGSVNVNSTHSTEIEVANSVVESLQKFVDVGIWLCQGKTKTPAARSTSLSRLPKKKSRTDLSPDEMLWLDFIDKTAEITKHVSASLRNPDELNSSTTSRSGITRPDTAKLLAAIRSLVQRSFTALLTSTSQPLPFSNNLSFLQILRAFLTRASLSSPSLSDLRSVLSSIFSAYAYEESMLGLANRLLDKDLFLHVHEGSELRQRGWRPRGSACEGCQRRVWGPGAMGNVFTKWEQRQSLEAERRKSRRATSTANEPERGKARVKDELKSKDGEAKSAKGKGKDGSEQVRVPDGDGDEENLGGTSETKDEDLGPLIILACRHVYHQSCLMAAMGGDTSMDVVHGRRAFRCPIDG